MGYCILHVIEIRYYLLLLHKILVKTKTHYNFNI